MTHTYISNDDWDRMTDYSRVFASNIRRKLPDDWYITVDDIQSEMYGEIASMVRTYKPGKKSLVSYFYEFAEKRVYSKLMTEYRKLKRNVQISTGNDDNDTEVKHMVGEGDVEALTVSDDTKIESRDMVQTIMDNVDAKGRRICEMVMQGYGQDEIAMELGISHQAIAKRLTKMR